MIRGVAWSATAEARMQTASHACLPYLKTEVLKGISQLWHCTDDDGHEAYLITRLDRNPTELVICYFEGSGMRKFGREVMAKANAAGVVVRAHTTNPAIARLARPLGLPIHEYVMRSEV